MAVAVAVVILEVRRLNRLFTTNVVVTVYAFVVIEVSNEGGAFGPVGELVLGCTLVVSFTRIGRPLGVASLVRAPVTPGAVIKVKLRINWKVALFVLPKCPVLVTTELGLVVPTADGRP